MAFGASRIPSIPARTCKASSSPNSANLSVFFARSNMKPGILQRIVFPLCVVLAAIENLVGQRVAVAEGDDAMIGQYSAPTKGGIGEQRHFGDGSVVERVELVPLTTELAQSEVHDADLHLGDALVAVDAGTAREGSVLAQAFAQLSFRIIELQVIMAPGMRPSHAGESKQRITELLLHRHRVRCREEFIDLGQQVLPQLGGRKAYAFD